MGFVNPDGTTTERYGEYRNPEKQGYAIANSMRELYEPLFEMNEKVHVNILFQDDERFNAVSYNLSEAMARANQYINTKRSQDGK